MKVLNKEDYVVTVSKDNYKLTKIYFDETKLGLNLDPRGDLMHITVRPPAKDACDVCCVLNDKQLYLYCLSDFAKFSRKLHPLLGGLDDFLDREFELVLDNIGHGFYVPVFDISML